MSFTFKVIDELIAEKPNKTCCRKAFLYGLFVSAQLTEDGTARAEFHREDVARLAAEIIAKQFSAEPNIEEYVRAGRKSLALTVHSKAVAKFLADIDSAECEKRMLEIVGFRCAECAHAFLKGVFTSAGSVNDPHSGYHLEISLPNAERAEKIAAQLASAVLEPKRVKRKGRVGLYCKSNSEISDILYYLGAVGCGFDVANISIERDIRNSENRATNCVARNIERSVSASIKQVEAIEFLMEHGAIDKLAEELRYTAQLRYENPSSSLSELALMHEPPISKSGLNRRLTKILEAEEDIRMHG